MKVNITVSLNVSNMQNANEIADLIKKLIESASEKDLIKLKAIIDQKPNVLKNLLSKIDFLKHL